MDRVPTKRSALEFLIAAGVEVGTVVDVGVLHGTPDLMAAFPRHRHVLFEPVAEYAPEIERAYALLDHVLVQKAASDMTGTMALALDGNTARRNGLEQQRQVEAITLDDYFAAHRESRPYLLKIDVDGFEMTVLQGATRTLDGTVCVVIEVYPRDWTERQSFLEARGFLLTDVVDFQYYRGRFAQADLVMVRKAVVDSRPMLSPTLHYPWDWSEWRATAWEEREA